MAAMFTVDFVNCFIFILLCLFSVIFYYDTISSWSGKQRSAVICLRALRLYQSLATFTFSSLLLHKSLQKLSSKYGPLLHLRVFTVPIVLVSSTSTAYEIFRTQDRNVSTRNLPTNEGSLFFGSSSFVTAPYGDYWKFAKKLIVTKILGPQVLQRSRGVREDETKRFYSNLLDKAMKKESVDIREEAMKPINNSICKMLMGRSCLEENGEADKVRSLVTESNSLLMKFILASILRKPLKKLGISLFNKELTDISRRFDELLETILVEHEEKVGEEEQHQGTNMVDVLLEAYRDKNAEYNITRNHIKSLVLALTPRSAIEWTMAEIINNPKVLDKLREKINSVVGKTSLIQETDLPNLLYLQAVVKEGLRLHPVVPVSLRAFQERCEIKGFYVPEKTTLVVNVYAIMRDLN